MLASNLADTAIAPPPRRRLQDEIVHHGPVPGALGRVRVWTEPADARGVRRARVRGPREDVVGYVACLHATDVGVGETALEITSVDEHDDGTLTVSLVYLDAPTGAA